MANPWSGLRCATGVLDLACAGAGRGKEYHVSPCGDDAGNGTRRRLRAGLEKVQLATRSARKERSLERVVFWKSKGQCNAGA